MLEEFKINFNLIPFPKCIPQIAMNEVLGIYLIF